VAETNTRLKNLTPLALAAIHSLPKWKLYNMYRVLEWVVK
jgi:hypothetical protein